MTATLKRRPPNQGARWTESEEALLATDSDRMIGERIGRSQGAVEKKRTALDIAAYEPRAYTWSAAELKLLGKFSDAEVARRLGVSRRCVIHERQRRKIGPCHPENSPKRRNK